MKVALFLDGDCYNKDAIFDDSPENWLNHDKLLHVWLNMKKYLNDRGVAVHTYDMYSGFSDIDKAIFFGLYSPNNEYLSRLKTLNIDCYYVAYEPPVIHHLNTAPALRSIARHFKKILTHQDDLIDNKKFFRVSEGKVLPDMKGYRKIPFSERYFMLMMNSYRYANFDSYRELYSERFRASLFFEKVSDEFHVYGRGLNNPDRVRKRWGHKRPVFFSSYVGEVENKMEVMCRYKFNLCFENCAGVYGYISEKILHSFRAGVVPVYWGPVNPTDYFPADTFIDVRQFQDYRALYDFLVRIDEGRFNEYLKAIVNYLRSDRYERFFGREVFGRQIYSMLTDKDESVEQAEQKAATTETTVASRHSKPRVSVLIPTRNRSQLLAQSLECLAGQKYADLEIVIVDDCSDDDTKDVVERFRERLPNMIYSRNEIRRGAAPGFRIAAELATGDYVLNFSDDDLLADGAIDSYVEPLKEQDYDLVYSDLAVIDGDGNQTAAWKYQSYPENRQLMRHLMDSGGNVIPEVLLVRKNIYSEVYGELYSKRFITPFYLAALRSLKMRHIGRQLYRYRVHKKSTFSDTSGLIIRNKGIINFMNLMMFMYSPVEIFQTRSAPSRNEQIVDSLIHYIMRLLNHGRRFFKGEFYTGSKYEESDCLWGIFYEYASYWLALARNYGTRRNELDQLKRTIAERFSFSSYDAVAVNHLPAVYSALPWFSYRPYSQPTDFVALDMVTLGRNDAFDSDSYSLFSDGDINIRATNRPVTSIEELKAYLEDHPIHVLNIFDPELFNRALNLLVGEERFFVCVVNATDRPYPEKDMPLKNAVTIDPHEAQDFNSFLELLSCPVSTLIESEELIERNR